MSQELREQLSRVLWMGGATDTGKSTVAQNLADRHGMYVYQYDKTDAKHLEKLAGTVPEIRKFNESSLDERWVYPEPAAMVEFLLIAFSHRFPLMLQDLLTLPGDKPIVEKDLAYYQNSSTHSSPAAIRQFGCFQLKNSNGSP